MHLKLVVVTLMALLSAAVPADDATSHQQFIVHLETGEAWDGALPPAEQAGFEEHSANMRRLREDGTILFGARYGEYGLLIVQAATLPMASEVFEADPGVMAGLFKFRIEPIRIFYPWKSVGD